MVSRTHLLLMLLAHAVLTAACATTSSSAGPTAPADGKTITLKDPAGDDNGPGTYKYPTGAEYKAGSFDMTELQVEPMGDTVEFRLTLSSRIEDPWDSKAWGGNGFSVQMAFIHLDTDHVVGSGVLDGLPGTNVRFKPEEAWDKVIVISPQGPGRLNAEVDTKAAALKERIIVPRLTRVSGRTLTAVVDAASLGGPVTSAWGFQVLMQSNEGFPDKGDFLSRKVNEFEGQHRFGGGTDYNNDPHVLDIFAEPPEAQAAVLGKYNKAATDPKPEDLAVVPMIYPAGK